MRCIHIWSVFLQSSVASGSFTVLEKYITNTVRSVERNLLMWNYLGLPKFRLTKL